MGSTAKLNFITTEFKSAYILIDDFNVLGLDCFGYDKYEGQVCSFEYVKDALNSKIKYNLYYPNYREKTSKHHPLKGWGLFVIGRDFNMKNLDDKRVKKMFSNIALKSCKKRSICS